jgi:hypothetical protein
MSADAKRELAERHGARFIKLRFVDEHGNSFGDTQRSIIGFQGLSVSQTKQGNGRIVVSLTYSKNAFGADTPEGALIFSPDAMQELIAYLPDTEFNRNKIARAMYAGNLMYEVVDESVRKSLLDRVNSIKGDPATKKEEERVAAERNAEIERQEMEARKTEPASLKRQRAETESLKELATVVKTLAEAQKTTLEKPSSSGGSSGGGSGGKQSEGAPRKANW